MRKLTRQEYKFFIERNKEFLKNSDPIESRFKAGFIVGLDYAQTKLDAYAAYIAGKITLKELEEVINA